MAITTFVASQILTAAQMNAVQGNDYNQTVSTKTASYTLVAADKGTRIVMNVASANTVTVNTSLFSAGDTLVIQNIGAGVTTVTAGTATVSSAGPLAIPQNGSGLLYFTSAGVSIFYPSAVTSTGSGLNLVKSQTIGTTVSSVAVTNAFSATYDSYFITVNGGISSTGAGLSFIFTGSTTGYYATRMGLIYSGATSSFGSDNNAAAFFALGICMTDGLYAAINLANPFLAKPTYGTFSFGQSDNLGGVLGFLNHQVATSYSGFTMSPSTGTITGGTIRVYGYATS